MAENPVNPAPTSPVVPPAPPAPSGPPAPPAPPAAPVSPPALPRCGLRRRTLVIGGIGAVAVAVLALLGWWVVAGNKIWTDGAALRVADADARLREVVWTKPELLSGLSAPDHEYEPSVSPDGDELYFVRGKAGMNAGSGHGAHIYVSYRRSGAWTTPVPVEGVNSAADDLGPRVTADNKFLLFYSNRPGGFGGYDIWAAPRLPAVGDAPGKWGEPFNLGPGVNSEFDEYSPDPSPDGKRLFFATNRKAAGREQKQAWRATIRAGASADFDLWYAERDEAAPPVALVVGAPTTAPAAAPAAAPGTGPSVARGSDEDADDAAKPQAAETGAGAPDSAAPATVPGLAFKNAREVPGVNTDYAEGASCVSPAGDFLYFASDRPGGYGKFDIYRCRVGTDGKFGPVENVGPPVNTPDNETDPQLALNGFRLYFSSDRALGGVPGVAGAPGSAAGSAPGAPPALSGGGAAVGDGRYALLQSDSREVFSLRQGHPLPHLGWSGLLLALSLLALIPLVMFMRKWDDQRLSLLQKCLLVSLLIHVLITLGMSIPRVTTQMYHYVRREKGLEPQFDLTLALTGPAGGSDAGGDVAAAVRQQSSNDLPTAIAPPTAAAPQASPAAEAIEPPPGVAVNVPQAGVGAPADTIQVEAPKAEPPKLSEAISAGPAVAPPTAPRAEAPEVKLPAAPHLAEAEAQPQVAPAAASAARADVAAEAALAKNDAAAVKPAAPAAQMSAQAGSLAQAATVRPVVPSIDLPDVGPKAALPEAPAAPNVAIARPSAAPLANRGPESPVVAEAATTAARQVVEKAAAAPAAPAGVASAVPTVTAPAGPSLAAEPVAPASPGAAALAAARGAAGSVDVRPASPGSLADVGLSAPRTTSARLSGAEATAVTEAVPGTIRRDKSAAVSSDVAGRPADVAAAAGAGAAPAARVTGGSLAAAPEVAPRVAPAEVATAAGSPAVPSVNDIPLRPSLPSAGAAPGPVASHQPDQPTAGEVLAGASREGTASGPGRPANIPENAPPTATPPAPGSAQSLAAAPAPAGPKASGAIGIAGGAVASVAPSTPADLSGAPSVTVPRPTTGPVRIADAGRPDAPTAADVAGGSPRRGTPGATTQPSVPDLGGAGLADAKVPTVVGSSEPLAGAPDLPAGAASARVALPAGTAVAAVPSAGASAPVGEVTVATRAGGAPRRADEASPSLASAAGSLPAAGPATRPVDAVAAVAAGEGPREIGLNVPAAPAAAEKATGGLAAAPTTRPLDAGAVALANAAPSALPLPVGIEGPRVELPKVGNLPQVAAGTSSPPEASGPAGASADPAGLKVTRAQPRPGAGATSGSISGSPAAAAQLASASIPGISAVRPAVSADPASRSLDKTAARLAPRTLTGPTVAAPQVSVALPALGVPEPLFQRSVEQRKPLVEKRGGTAQSEAAVDRALAYLAREQEPDGRWTVFNDDGKPGNRPRHPHDMACTGLATLAFLTADHTPAKEGPYRAVVSKGLDFLLARQGEDGDFRGPRGMRGAGADHGNLYDQGICTMAMSEAALMTGDPRYTEAARKAADFIVRCQNPQGGWRYSPQEAGDTSVFGWQILALHDAEQLGFEVPEQTKAGAKRFLKGVSRGRTRILAGYMPGHGPSYAMTAEALFSRLLLGEEISPPQTAEVSQFLTSNLPRRAGADFYFWYYASLSLSQMPEVAKAERGDAARDVGGNAGDAELNADFKAKVSDLAWKKWNGQARDTLIAMQRRGGAADGSWAESNWAERGGRVFTTSLATLTLEVYYRYLPLRPAAETEDAEHPGDARPAAAEIRAPRAVERTAAPPTRNPAAQKSRRRWEDQGGHYPPVEPN